MIHHHRLAVLLHRQEVAVVVQAVQIVLIQVAAAVAVIVQVSRHLTIRRYNLLHQHTRD